MVAVREWNIFGLMNTGFPEGINDKLYTADWTSGKIFKFDMTQDDATYKVKQEGTFDLVRATDIDVDGRIKSLPC